MSTRSDCEVSMTYYKCLQSHGDTYWHHAVWPMPITDNGIDWEPGAWLEVPAHRKLSLCRVGLHVTDQPALWTWTGTRVWECEVDGDCIGDLEPPPRKLAFRRARLLRPVAQWEIYAVRDRWLASATANLRGADLRYADLRYADLRYADLRGADLRYADLRWADLRHADLRVADLRGAELRWADLRYADLRWADLSWADLRWAKLRGALRCAIEPPIPGWRVRDGRLEREI